MKKYCIAGTTNQLIINKLKAYGYEQINVEKSTDVSQPIAYHADVLYLKTSDREIYISECQKNNAEFIRSIGYDVKTVRLMPGYKTESRLNIVVTDSLIMCNPKTCMDIAQISEKKMTVYTNQGYTKCSTAVIGDNNFITEDENIYKVLTKAEKNCLLIKKGYVRLDGYDCGFIGGASVYIKEKNTVLFTGNIQKHPDYIKIKDFCNNQHILIDYIDNDDLYDIGGIVLL
ncbi:MAG: hypothetical protein IKA10_01635 [Oscillospiraceae bacterium]|nr:hypothetical protein [Oscillospiraceae bacterium]